VIVNQLPIIHLSWPTSSWAIYKTDFGPEDDEGEGGKRTSLPTFSFDQKLQPEKHTCPAIQ
jgi:hypothetical protein